MIDARNDFVSTATAALLNAVGYVSETTPTLYDAAKWLRYEQDVSVEPISTKTKGTDRTYRVFVNSKITVNDGDFESYEDALEYGIKEGCLIVRKRDALSK